MTVKMPEPMTAPMPRAVERPRPEGLFQGVLGLPSRGSAYRWICRQAVGLAAQFSSSRRRHGCKVQGERLQKEDEHSDEDVFPEYGNAYAAVYMMRFEPGSEGITSAEMCRELIQVAGRKSVRREKLKTPGRHFHPSDEDLSAGDPGLRVSRSGADVSRSRALPLDCPRASFLTFFLLEPRGVVRLALGAAFLRAARFSFLRSVLSSILVVSATKEPLSRASLMCPMHGTMRVLW